MENKNVGIGEQPENVQAPPPAQEENTINQPKVAEQEQKTILTLQYLMPQERLIMAEQARSSSDVLTSSAEEKPEVAPEKEPEAAEKQPEEAAQEQAPQKQSSAGKIVIAIAVMMAVVALLAILVRRGYQPVADQGADEPTLSETEVQTEPIISAIPCTGLSLDGSVDELTFAGQYRRISVRVTPENTTDQVTYTSGDPKVVTVDDKGHVTAVGEGQTVIVISCGSKRIDTPIVVKFAESATETSANPSETTGGTDTAVAMPAPGNILALKRNGKTVSDVTIGKIGVLITLELDNNIPAESVMWSTSDSNVATVYNGNVTAIGKGNCVIRAEYNGQTAECTIRVI